MLVSFLSSISSYSFSTCSSSLLFSAETSFTNPLKAITLSLSPPNRSTSLCKHWCADKSSPVRRHDSSRFSYLTHSSGLSAVEKRDGNGDELTLLGDFCRTCGARCDSCKAEAGESKLGGCSKDGAILNCALCLMATAVGAPAHEYVKE